MHRYSTFVRRPMVWFTPVMLLAAWAIHASLQPGSRSGAAVAADPQPAADARPLRCTIRGEATCELGKAPKVTVAITNLTEKDIYLVGSLDASDYEWR